MNVDLLADRLPDDDLYPAWCYVEHLEQQGKLTQFEALRWKHGIFSVMLERGLGADQLIRLSDETMRPF